MIVPMTKYDIVVYYRDGDGFLDSLQELGLVDVTTTGWEPTAEDVALMAEIERRRAAAGKLRHISAQADPEQVNGELRGAHGSEAVLPDNYTAEKAWGDYLDATEHLDDLNTRLAAAVSEAEQLEVWGRFDPQALRELSEAGVGLRFFSAYTRDFREGRKAWGTVVPLNEVDGVTYFVAIGDSADIDARELPTPRATASQKRAETEQLERERMEWEGVLERAAAGVALIEKQADNLAEKLDLSRVAAAAARPAEGKLILLEGWATRETAPLVDGFLDGAGVYYEKSAPTPQDEVPVVLKNRRWSSPFEIIGNFYSLPRYGTLDLTAFFGPFYMVFFGFCLGDAGYGLMFVLGGSLLRYFARKKAAALAADAKSEAVEAANVGASPQNKQPMLVQISNLTFLCGGAAMVFGFLAGGFFGIELPKLPMFADIRQLFLTPDTLFLLALALGVVQILFALILRMVSTTRQFGFKYCLGTLGWFMVVCAILYVALPAPGVHKLLVALTLDYPVHMPVFYALAGVGGVLMLFFHNPAKNPLANFGGGLWNTYNDVTGLLGDLLSYIRLFALCLSGGTLALVFNKLAGAMPIPLMIIVLIFGHALNLFMSALGSFVHPMRLTFVEFYKNVGFEAAQREFKPLARKQKG